VDDALQPVAAAPAEPRVRQPVRRGLIILDLEAFQLQPALLGEHDQPAEILRVGEPAAFQVLLGAVEKRDALLAAVVLLSQVVGAEPLRAHVGGLVEEVLLRLAEVDLVGVVAEKASGDVENRVLERHAVHPLQVLSMYRTPLSTRSPRLTTGSPRPPSTF
jgi:hypothetical protein